jgi:choline dehydrogenase
MTRRAVVATGLATITAMGLASSSDVQAQDRPEHPPLDQNLVPSQTAVVMVDFQNNFASPEGSGYAPFAEQFRSTHMIENSVHLVTAARALRIQVIHVTEGYADDYREVTFKAQEDWEGGANEWRGAGGPVHIRRPSDPHPTAPAFLEAARRMGFPILDDVNGPMLPGAGYINMNIAPDGTRISSARAFLRPNLNRPNLTLLLNTDVTKIVFDGDRASGVELVVEGATTTVTATREVILAAGTIHTPQLLMLSGVGDAAQLRKFGIRTVADLRGVGRNLQDHVLVSGVVYEYKSKMPERPADSNGVEAEVYFSSGVDDHPTDINLVLEQFPIATPEAAARFGSPPQEGFTIAPALIQPTSRGEVRLASADWRDRPVIQGNHLGTDRDLLAIVRAIEVARELGSNEALDEFRGAEVVPGPKATSREDLIELARTAGASFGHGVGTARIGTDPDAVVDSELRVHGVRNLRVADASVMPSIISGPTNAASFMIGGRAAHLIKAASN